MNFFNFLYLKKEVDKSLKRKEIGVEKEITNEEKEESNKRYELWQKNTYNPYLNYYGSREDKKK